MSVTLPIRNQYSIKDQAKANNATKFIGRGSINSSTRKYARAFAELANCVDYTSEDKVFISAEGKRARRISIDDDLICTAAMSKVQFITDVPYHRNREYNIGERDVAALLQRIGYTEEVQEDISTGCEYALWSIK